MLILITSIGFGMVLAAARFKVLIMVPVLILLGITALATWDLGPVIAGIGAQAGYLIGSLAMSARTRN